MEGRTITRADLSESVFQEVGLSSVTKFLVPGADTIPNHDCNNWRRVDFLRQDYETITKNGFPNIFSSKG